MIDYKKQADYVESKIKALEKRIEIREQQKQRLIKRVKKLKELKQRLWNLNL